MNLRIRSLQHVGIPVTDLARSETFYGQLGFKKVMTGQFPHEDGQGSVAMMQLEGIIIELYRFPDPGRAGIDHRDHGHIDHIAFDVPDIDEAFGQLKKDGYQLQEEEPLLLPFWSGGCRYFNLIGPDGERLEFNQIL